MTPYGGLVYDIDDTWSAFLSYTEIFQPQYNLDASGSFLDPVVGQNYETGIKAAWFDGVLNASFSIFRIEQENASVAEGQLPSGRTYYSSADGVVSKGVDAELSGTVTDNLDMTAGFTHYTATDDAGAFNPDRPRTQLKLFTSYRVPQWRQLTIGGGARWQNHTFAKGITSPTGNDQYDQDGYTLVDVFGRYQFTSELALQVNVKNLFDEKYYSYFDGYGVYGEPRSVSSTLTYAF